MVSNVAKVDFGRTADDYRNYGAELPSEFFDRALGFGIGVSGQCILDIGTGTGILARQFVERGCRVVGLDISAPLVVQARALGEEQGVAVEYRIGSAEDNGLDAGGFDVVTAGQCWHWFDRKAVAAEAMRVLPPGGAIARPFRLAAVAGQRSRGDRGPH